MATPKRVFWTVAVLLVIVLYVASYFTKPSGVHIIQTTLVDFRFDLLREKQPIVVDDRVAALAHIGRLWFPHNITTPFRMEGSQLWHVNRFKYTVMHAEQEGDVYLYPYGRPLTPDGAPSTEETLVAVHLLPGQMLIVPFRWRYLVAEPMRLAALGVHDYVTYVLP